MIEKPSDHISFGKKLEMRGRPYPVNPSDDRTARSFLSAGSEKSRRVWSSSSLRRSVAMPWLTT